MAATSANGGDIQIYATPNVGNLGSQFWKVKPGPNSPGAIQPGQLVVKALGDNASSAGASYASAPAAGITAPSVGSNYIIGISESASTEGTVASGTAGSVNVTPNLPGSLYLIIPNSTSTYGVGSTPVQATYDALVGARVKINVSSTGTQTLLAVDNSANGCVVMPLDVTKPQNAGKVLISLRQALNFNA